MPMKWWNGHVAQQVLPKQRWVTFDLETVLMDTLANSPRIQSVSNRTTATVHRIVQQDAAFDPSILLGGDLGATNDPVGNTLTTGGADRLQEQSLDFRGGMKRTTRRGTELEWSQEIGFLDSNSSFFVPNDQGNAKLSLSLTKPLLARGGRYYNERLVIQARIENRLAWQEMRSEVEQRIADVIAAYWNLYQMRAQLTQQRDLIERSQHVERVISSRKGFDAGRIEIIKARSRVARRQDRVIELETELEKAQARLASLIGSETLQAADDLELIPILYPEFSDTHWQLRDAVAQALENRPEVRVATHDLELAAHDIRVSRTELAPQLNWVFNGYLSQLNGGSQVARSFWEQFANGPGISTGLEYEVPRGRRASKAKLRESQAIYRQRTADLQEVIQKTRFEVEAALIDVRRYALQRESKRKVLEQAIDEENILTVKWRLIGSDGSRVGVVLETLLDAQQRRTDAEQALVAAETSYLIAQVQLQRAMGTLLIDEGIHATQAACSAEIAFHRDPEYPSPAELNAQPMTESIPMDGETTAPGMHGPIDRSIDTDTLPPPGVQGVGQDVPPAAVRGKGSDEILPPPTPRPPAQGMPRPVEQIPVPQQREQEPPSPSDGELLEAASPPRRIPSLNAPSINAPANHDRPQGNHGQAANPVSALGSHGQWLPSYATSSQPAVVPRQVAPSGAVPSYASLPPSNVPAPRRLPKIGKVASTQVSSAQAHSAQASSAGSPYVQRHTNVGSPSTSNSVRPDGRSQINQDRSVPAGIIPPGMNAPYPTTYRNPPDAGFVLPSAVRSLQLDYSKPSLPPPPSTGRETNWQLPSEGWSR